MSDHEQQLQSYQVLGRQGDKVHDDLIGRRIIKGLGFTNATKVIYELERRAAGETQGELPLWLRAQRLFLIGLRQLPDWNYLTNRWRPDTLNCKHIEGAINLIQIADDYIENDEDVPLIYARILNTMNAYAVTLWLVEELQLLKPPFKVYPADIQPKWRVVVQSIDEFVTQFGPYEFKPEVLE